MTSRRRNGVRHYRPTVAILGLTVALLTAACGSQVDHDRVVAAAGASEVDDSSGDVSAGGGAGAGGTSVPGSDLTGGGAGGGNAAPGVGGAGDGGAPSAEGDPSTPAAAGGGGGGQPSAANGTPVVLGNIGSYTGVVGAMFPGGPASLQAWAQSVNARGGLNGHPVKIVSGNDGGDPARALSLVRQMVEEQGAIALVGSMVPLSLSGIRDYLEDNEIPLVGGDVTLPQWIESPVIFPSGTDVGSISVAAIRLLAEAGGTKLAMLWCGESPGCSGIARAAEADTAGMELAFSSQISLVQTDFTTECLRAKDAGVDTIFVAADANTVQRVGRSCVQQDLKPLYGTASIAVGPHLADDPNLEGLIAPTNNAPWFDSSTPGGKLYTEAIRAYAPGTPLSAPGSAMFTSGLLVEEAAGALGENPTSAELLAGLRGLRGVTAQGMAPPMTFRKGPSGPISCYFVVMVRGGDWVAPNGASPKCL